MKKRRILFATTWSFLTILGLVLAFTGYLRADIAGLFFGFHFPSISVAFMGIFAIGTDWPFMVLLIALLLICEIVLWIVGIIQINKIDWFEKLICIDKLSALFLVALSALLLEDDFAGQQYMFFLVIENILMFIILFSRGKLAINSVE